MVEDGEDKQGLQTTNLKNLGYNNVRAYTCLKGFDGSLFDGTFMSTILESIFGWNFTPQNFICM